MKKIKKKLLIFDLDGVIIDSEKNMNSAWNYVQQKYSLENVKFKNYFKHIGRPFNEILKKLGIKKNHNKIKKTYQLASIKFKKQIRYFNNTILVLNKFYKENYILSIVTSKDLNRTKKFLKNNIKLFQYIECDNNKDRGKPFPDKINKIISKSKLDKSYCVYIGDTNIDFKTAKNAKIDFIFAKWGYGINYNYKYKCDKIINLPKMITLS